MNFGVLNFIHRFNSSNTIFFNFCGFYFCFFREQDMIFCCCILLIFSYLAAQNNPVIINSRYSFGNTLENNHNIKKLSIFFILFFFLNIPSIFPFLLFSFLFFSIFFLSFIPTISYSFFNPSPLLISLISNPLTDIFYSSLIQIIFFHFFFFPSVASFK